MSTQPLQRVTDDITEGAAATETAQTQFKLGLVTTAGGKYNSVQKKIVYIDGKAKKDPTHSLNVISGQFADRTVTGMAGLAGLIAGLTPIQALTLGVCGLEQTQKLVTSKKYDELTGDFDIAGQKQNIIARTKKHIKSPEDDAFFTLLDVDAEPGKPKMTAQVLLSLLTSVIPGFATVGSVITQSTSSHIYHRESGVCLAGEGNFHVFIPVRGNVERFIENLKTKLWAANLGVFKLATPNKQTGVSAVLERFPIDMSVFSPERLVYEAGALLPKELEQRRGKPIAVEGTILDLDAIVATPEEIALAKTNRERARSEIVATRLEQAIDNVCEADTSVTRETAEKRATQLIEDAETGVLSRDHVLYFEDGTEITAGDLGKSHLWKKMCDPQEPDYDGGRFCAQVIPLKGGVVGISSFAHGERKYTIAPPEGKESKKEKPPKKFPTREEVFTNWDTIPDETDSKLLRAMRIVQTLVQTDLKFNELTSEIELFGKPLDPNANKLTVCKLLNEDISEENATIILRSFARQNAYHPVKIYLEKLNETHGASTVPYLDSAAHRLFGTSNPLYDVYFRKQLIAAVARIYEPGCKVDTATVLQSGQGYLKGRFWRHLFGDDFFGDSLGSDLENKDELLKLNSSWGQEWAELDQITTKKELGLVKAFLSRQVDTYRSPYERTAVKHPRRSVIVGSVNPSEFLKDDENRRFWIIPLGKKIDIEQVKSERDALWAAAVALYKAGEEWWLTDDEADQQRTDNLQYAVRDVWEDTIADWVSSTANTRPRTDDGVMMECTRIQDILTLCLGMIDVQRHTNLDKKRVQDILKRLGWTAFKNPVRLSGFNSPQRAWFKATPEPTPEPTQIPIPEPTPTPVAVPPPNPEPVSKTEFSAPPVTLDLGVWESDEVYPEYDRHSFDTEEEEDDSVYDYSEPDRELVGGAV